MLILIERLQTVYTIVNVCSGFVTLFLHVWVTVGVDPTIRLDLAVLRLLWAYFFPTLRVWGC